MGRSKSTTILNEDNVREELRKLLAKDPSRGASSDIDFTPLRSSVDTPVPRRPAMNAAPAMRSSTSMPSMCRSSTEQALSYNRAPRSSTLASSTSSSALGAVRAVPMQALLAAAQRIVDPRDLPADRPGMRTRLRDMDFPTKQVEATFKSKSPSLHKPVQVAQSPQVTKPLKDGAVKTHYNLTWSTQEERSKLNNALERLGQPRHPPMKGISPEIENIWLRKEVTSQLLQSLLQSDKKAPSIDSEGSTRLGSTATSGRATPDIV